MKDSITLLLNLQFLSVWSTLSLEISREVVQKPAPEVDSPEQHERWEKMGQILKKYSAPMIWKFTPEQIQDPDKMAEYLKESCCGSSRQAWSCAGPWLLPTTHCYCTAPSGEGKESRPTSTMATDTAAETEQQPMPIAVTSVKKKSKTKSILAGSNEEESGSSKPVEETGPEIPIHGGPPIDLVSPVLGYCGQCCGTR